MKNRKRSIVLFPALVMLALCMLFGTGAKKQEDIAETEVKETEQESECEGEIISEIRECFLNEREANGEVWAVVTEDLSEDARQSYNEKEVLLSASVIKVFILGTVRQAVEENVFTEEAVEKLCYDMITVSDNDASNTLVEMLGEGDFDAGAKKVNQFCEKYGFTGTSLNRRFLGTNEHGDNYTCAKDCADLLKGIYVGSIVSEASSEKMLELLKAQTCKWKIPEGIPAEVKSANKTGEMPDGYGLGCIENDIAIVFAPDRDYILVVLSNELGGKNDEAMQVIRNISSCVYAHLG